MTETQTFSRVIVPLDGSPESAQALPVAAALAQRWQAPLQLVRVAVPLPRYGNAPVIDNRLSEELARTDLAALRETAVALTASHGIRAEAVQLDGEVVPALAAHLEAVPNGFVVMTSHGRGGFSRLWFGSVTDGLIRHVARPVLVMPATAAPVAVPPDGSIFRHVLVPLDGSALALRALDVAMAFATAPDVELHLVEVLETEPTEEPFPDMLEAAERERAVERLAARSRAVVDGLERVARDLGRPPGTVHTHALVSPRPAAALLDYARNQRVDLISVATHGRGGVERAAVGSVADKVVRGAEVPVVVCRPAQA